MRNILSTLIVFAVIIGLWQLAIVAFKIPSFILAAPWDVVQKIVEKWDVLLKHAQVTLIEMLLGLLIGFFFGVFSALWLTASRSASKVFMPILILIQAVPVFAIAPLLVLWLGFGIASKVAMAVLIIYFPVVMSCYDGLRNTPTQWMHIAESMGASQSSVLLKIRLPSALPSLASGLRMAVTFAPIGAIIGEWVGSSEGLGYLMINANARSRIDMTFAALFVLIVMQLLLFFSVDKALKKLIPWESKR